MFLVAREIFRILEGLSGNSLKVLGGSFLELCAAYEATGVALCLGSPMGKGPALPTSAPTVVSPATAEGFTQLTEWGPPKSISLW